MKKVLFSMLLVVLTVCLFVGCSSSPSSRANGNNEGYIIMFPGDDESPDVYYLVFKQNGNWTLIYGIGDFYCEPLSATTFDGTTVVFDHDEGNLSFNVNTLKIELGSSSMGTLEKVKINSYTEGGLLCFTYNENTISANYKEFKDF